MERFNLEREIPQPTVCTKLGPSLMADRRISVKFSHDGLAQWLPNGKITAGPNQTLPLSSNEGFLTMRFDVALFIAALLATPTATVAVDIVNTSSPAVDIPDPGTVVDSIVVTDSLSVADVNCTIDITHPFVGDLVVEIESPVSTMVSLTSLSGSSESDVRVTFDANGNPFGATLLASGIGFHMQSQGPGELDDFSGEDSAGTWTLSVSDTISTNSGQLNEWTLALSDTTGGPVVPVHDVCDFAIQIFDDTTTQFDTTFASESGFASDCDSALPTDVWYTLEIPCDGVYTASTCGSNFDTVLSVWDGTAACPTLAHAPIGCDDDTCGLQSEVSWPATAGDVVFLQVGGVGAVGSGQLSISSTAVPANDACLTATPIASGETPFVTVCATSDGVAFTCEGDTFAPIDIWFIYTANCTGQLNVDTFGADFDTSLAAWPAGVCPSGGTPSSFCSNDATDPSGIPTTQSALVIDVLVGETILLQVGGGNAEAVGHGAIHLTCLDSTTPTFRRGDANQDALFDISDPVYTLDALFGSGGGSACFDAMDANDDGNNDVADVVFCLSALFVLSASQPPAPGPTRCGVDPTADSLDCDQYDCL